MKIKVDLHCHGPNEWRYNPQKWNPKNLAKLAAERGLNALGIAEMSETDQRFEKLKLAGKDDPSIYVDCNQIWVPEYKVLLFRTEEISTKINGKPQGHVLVFGNKNKIVKGSLEEVLDKANEQRADVIAVHAFDGLFDRHFRTLTEGIVGVCYANSPDKILDYFNKRMIHAMEYNGALASLSIFNKSIGTEKKNQMAVDFARKNNLYLTASTDAHCVPEMCGDRAYTSFEAPDPISSGDYADFIRKSLRNFGNKVVPIMRPGPALCVDNHVGHILAITLLSKIGYNPDKNYLK